MDNLQERYINPLTDYGFKRLFGTEPNKELLIDFLNQILPPQHQIQDLSYSKNEHLGLNLIDRSAIFDIYCKGPSGEAFIVEIQKARQNYFKDRSVFYSSFPIQEQAKRGKWDFRLYPVYTVGILDFVFDDHKRQDEFLHIIELKDQNCEVFYDKLKYIYIELPKFTKTEEQLENHFDKWLYVFKHLSQLTNRPTALQERIFERLFHAAEIARFSKSEREAYEESLKHYRDIQNVVDTSRQEGRAEGRKEGLQEGMVKGMEERNVTIAREMKQNGEPIEKIMQYTQLSQEEIEKL